MILRAFLLALLVLPSSIAVAAGKPKAESADAALSNPGRLVNIGDHARASSDYMLALSFYERALNIDPEFVPALRAATEVALAIRLQQALALAERWVSKQPRDGLAHLAVAAALVQQNRPTEAQRSIALAEAAGGPPVAIAVQRGLAYDLLGQSKNAQIAFADAMQRAPGDRTIVEYLALSLAIGGDDAAALALLQPEAGKATGHPSFERTLILIHALAGRIDLAQRIASTNLDKQSAASVADLLQRVSALPTPKAKAAAVHIGLLPDKAGAAPTQQAASGPQPDPAPQVTVRESRQQPTQVPTVAPPQVAVREPQPQPAAEAPKPMPQAKPPTLKPAAIRPPPKQEPLPPGVPRLSAQALKSPQLWVQVGSSPDRKLLSEELAKLRKKSRGTLTGYNAYVEAAPGTNRILVGPFKSRADVDKVTKRLKSTGIESFPKSTAAGSNIAPL